MPSTDHRRTWPEDLSSYCFEVPFGEETVLFDSARGIHLTDTAGRSYIDSLSGVFVSCFGYSCEPIVDAVTQQLRKLPFNPPLHGTNPAALALTDALARLAPEGLNTVKLVNGGSEAVEASLRLARLTQRELGNPGRYKLLSYYHGYHGATFGSLSLTGRPDVTRFGPSLPGVVHVWSPDMFASVHGTDAEESGRLAAEAIERTIQAEGPDSVAALVMEPVIHLRGMAIAPPGYLARVREICDRYGVLLVFDEIVTGFGRTGQPFAAQTFGATPDLMAVGKGISGGYAPLAAVLFNDKVAGVLTDASGTSSFAPSHTYAANPLAAAAGLASVTLYSEGGYLDSNATLATSFTSNLTEALGDRGDLRSVGLLYGAKLRPLPDDPEGSAGAAVASACQERGLILRGQDDWITLAPAFTTTEEETAEICGKFTDALDKVYGGRM
ncbi:aminotransferase class III-fold pyridoxal phosphate-dependent enzyme [Streptomyces sp. SID12488]|uniref:aminotransferase family protein n=1 Tax=Streptomyces sp. SID12488 TaxID=2706040 RepID=UPI0013DB815D|nr:aminotransferase class III-fold pyridoxal phosphate-dependent enzyme [Streptomyces sp. SID12488]NEA69004.1 aspartate aminotransferase family protein [Streptomyces sp. SID12488]